MPFCLTEDQWINCKNLIETLKGYKATEFVQLEIETLISKVFVRPGVRGELEIALRNASVTAEKFELALSQLVCVEDKDINLSDSLMNEARQQDIIQTKHLISLIKTFNESFNHELNWRFGCQDEHSKGRPTDVKIVDLCIGILKIAKHERWIYKSKLGNTSPAMIDFVLELSNFARDGGLTYFRDRRAIARAMMKARERHETDEREAAQLYAALDMVGRS